MLQPRYIVCILTLTCSLLPLAQGASLSDSPTFLAQRYFAAPEGADVKISPDGQLAAMLMPDTRTGEDRQKLAVIDLKSHVLTPFFETAQYGKISRFWWVGDRRLLVYLTSTEIGVQVLPIRRLIAINTDGKGVTLITSLFRSIQSNVRIHRGNYAGNSAFGNVLHLPRDNADSLVISAYTPKIGINAYSVNTQTGNLKKLTDSLDAGFHLFADSNGQVRFACKYDWKTGEQEFYYRKPGSGPGWGEVHKLKEVADPLGPETGPIGFAPDNKTIYWVGRTPESTLGLYRLNPLTLKKTLLFGNPAYDIESLVWSLREETPREIVMVKTEPGLPEFHVLDPSAVQVHLNAMLNHTFPDQDVDITSASRDGTKFIVYVHSDRNPGTYYFFDDQNKSLQFLFRELPGIDPTKTARMQPVTFKDREGVLLHGYLALPHGGNGTRFPLLINPHGGPESRNNWSWDSELQYFVANGYAVFQVNYRGSTGYGKKFLAAGYRQWGGDIQSDIADSVQWAVKQGYADPKRVCIYGSGFGGYTAIENTILYPAMYQCAAGFDGTYDLTLTHSSDFWGVGYLSRRLNKYLDMVLGNDESVLRSESPVYQAEKIKVPLFIAYGGEDKFVSPKNSEELISALDKSGQHYEKMYEPKESGNYQLPADRIELYTRMLVFFNKYIGPDAAKH